MHGPVVLSDPLLLEAAAAGASTRTHALPPLSRQTLNPNLAAPPQHHHNNTQVLALLRELGICHCDLKPENILLQNLHSPAIKLIDFGSACYATRPLHTYIQSRFYRSPEVMLGCQYGTQIDMWSFGAIVGELFLGLPLFPGETEYNQMHRIVKMRGVPPEELLLTAPLAKRFFERVDENGNSAVPAAAPAPAAAEAPAPAAAAASSGTGGVWRLRSEESFCREHGGSPCRNKQYFKYATLPELVAHHPPPKSANGGARPAEGSAEALAEKERRMAMLHFCEGLLQILPSSRWTPLQSLRHPFITGEPFTGTFSPPPQEATTTTAASSSSSPAATAPAKAEERTSSSSSGSPATTTASEPAKPQCNISISPASPPQSAREEAASTTSAKPAPAPPSAAPATASTAVDKPAAPAPPPRLCKRPRRLPPRPHRLSSAKPREVARACRAQISASSISSPRRLLCGPPRRLVSRCHAAEEVEAGRAVHRAATARNALTLRRRVEAVRRGRRRQTSRRLRGRVVLLL